MRQKQTQLESPSRARPLLGQAVLFIGLVVVSSNCGASEAKPSTPLPASVATAEPCLEAVGGPSEVVKALYAAYPASGSRVVQNEPREVLLRYFDESLVAMVEADLTCRRRTGDLCGISANVLFAATDAKISDFHVCAPSQGRDTVEVRFRNFGEATSVWFEMKKTPAGWRIRDIRYEGGGSLVGSLSAR